MKSASHLAIALAILIGVSVLSVSRAAADEGPLDKSQPKGVTVDEIIQRFSAKEKEFKEAYDQYGYRESASMETLDGSTVDGQFKEVFDVSFDDEGHRVKDVVFAPLPTLQRLVMTRQDYDDLENGFPMVLTSDQISDYNVLYVGQQQEDELHCYVFDIAPKQVDPKKRYFQGRIWVDDHDFQIVKTYGQMVPETRLNKKGKGQENLFPKFTTWRQQIDGKYWFPVYTRADDTLHFVNQDVHVREIVKYENYRRFGSKAIITYEGKELPKGEQKDQSQTPPQKPPQ